MYGYTVQYGLGGTMTNDDVLRGVVNVTVQVAAERPADFVVLSLQLLTATAA